LNIKSKLMTARRLVQRHCELIAASLRKPGPTGWTAPVIVSLTTYPKRASGVHFTLLSLLDQTVRPQKIVLVLSRDQFPKEERSLPRVLLRTLTKHRHVLDLIWTDGDDRSYKKLIPAVRKYPERPIITADDDVLYDRDLVERLWKAHQKWPDATIGTRGHAITQAPESKGIRPYSDWERPITDRPHKSTLLTGVGGILYPPGVISGRSLDSGLFMTECPTADDIWFKCAAMSSGVPAVMVSGGDCFVARIGTRSSGLWQLGANDGQLITAMEVHSLVASDFAD